MKRISSASDLEEARSQAHALAFLRVAWSMQARRSEEAVRALAESWQAAYPDCPAPTYVADLSDQAGEVWQAVRAWLGSEGQPIDQLTYGGGGALLWVESGAVKAAVPTAGAVGKAELMAITQRAFPSGATPRQ